MDKEEREYYQKYGNISTSLTDRLSALLQGNNRTLKGKIIEDIRNILGMKWETINLVVWLIPKPTPRPRYSSSSHTFYVKGSANNHKRFLKFLKKTELSRICTPCKFRVVSYLPTPSSMNKAEKILAELGLLCPISKPDWDNLGKAYSDMVQQALIMDDALIFSAESIKRYSIKPRVEIEISYMMDFDCEYNRKKISNILRKE